MFYPLPLVQTTALVPSQRFFSFFFCLSFRMHFYVVFSIIWPIELDKTYDLLQFLILKPLLYSLPSSFLSRSFLENTLQMCVETESMNALCHRWSGRGLQCPDRLFSTSSDDIPLHDTRQTKCFSF